MAFIPNSHTHHDKNQRRISTTSTPQLKPNPNHTNIHSPNHINMSIKPTKNRKDNYSRLMRASLVKIKNSNITKAIEESLNLIGYKIPENITNIVIKPNLCYYWDYSAGQTTDPKFIAALINLI
jgi:hypothetical protein